MTMSAQNSRGGYVPAIPIPLHIAFQHQCPGCGRRFTRLANYRGHYALTHILGLPED